MHALLKAHELATAAALMLTVAFAQAATPIHLYTFDGTLADSFGGPSLVDNGGTLGAGAYRFGPNQGLSVLNALPVSTYTLDVQFAFDVTGSYRKIIDFQNLANDQGLYALGSALDYFPLAMGPTGAVNDATLVRVTLSRDGATQLVSGYVDGVLQLSFTDSANVATFGASGQIGHFFIDDFSTGQREASSGFVDHIAIYDTALSASEIETLSPVAAVPEPAQGAMLLAGLGALGWFAQRRRR